MEVSWPLAAMLLGAAGIGGFVTAITQAIISIKKAPLEKEELEGNITQAMTDAAEKLVSSQTTVLASRDAEIDALKSRVDNLEAQVQSLLNEIEMERSLRADREHELTQHRLMLAEQQATIDHQAKQLRSQSARITALKKAVAKLGGDPDEIAPTPEKEED